MPTQPKCLPYLNTMPLNVHGAPPKLNSGVALYQPTKEQQEASCTISI